MQIRHYVARRAQVIEDLPHNADVRTFHGATRIDVRAVVLWSFCWAASGGRPPEVMCIRGAASYRPIRDIAEAGYRSVDGLVVVAHLDELRDAHNPGLRLLRIVDAVEDRIAVDAPECLEERLGLRVGREPGGQAGRDSRALSAGTAAHR